VPDIQLFLVSLGVLGGSMVVLELIGVYLRLSAAELFF